MAEDHTCQGCDLLVKGICRAHPGIPVDPRGDCPSWQPRERLTKPKCEQHASLNRATELLLRGYPAIWYQQADAIATVLQATKRKEPNWARLAEDIWDLRKWVPKGYRRDFRKQCADAGASIKGRGW